MSKNEINIFLSSTFKDMGEIRNSLKYKIRASLNNIVGKIGKNIYLYEYEFGIPDGTDHLEVLNYCYKKIHSSDYFIFIMGSNYGTSVQDYLTKEPEGEYIDTLKEGLEKNLSLSETEIIESFKTKALNGKRIFLIDSNYNQSDNETIDKLSSLTERINKNRVDGDKIIYYTDYSDMKNSLINYFNDAYSSEINNLSIEDQNRNLFYANKSAYYVENNAGIKLLDDYVNGNDNRIFILQGESGSGKSTIISQWLSRNINSNDRRKYLQYYIGIGRQVAK